MLKYSGLAEAESTRCRGRSDAGPRWTANFVSSDLSCAYEVSVKVELKHGVQGEPATRQVLSGPVKHFSSGECGPGGELFRPYFVVPCSWLPRHRVWWSAVVKLLRYRPVA